MAICRIFAVFSLLMGTLAAAELDVKPLTPMPGDAATLRARQRFLAVRSFTVFAGPVWKPYSERYPIPAGDHPHHLHGERRPRRNPCARSPAG